MLSKQIAGQSLPLLPPGHVPIRTFLCAIPAAFSHALFGGAGLVHWLSALQMGAELLFWQAKKGVFWGRLENLGRWFLPFAVSWAQQSRSRREKDGAAPFEWLQVLMFKSNLC